MRIALAQINPTVGDIDYNAQLIERDLDRASAAGADLVVFPELALIGYPPRDLLLKPAVLERCEEAIADLAQRCCQDVAAIVGYPMPAMAERGRRLHNAAVLLAEGRIQHRYVKCLLPTYDVFDELRYFEPGVPGKSELANFNGVRIGVTICEDLWNDQFVVEHQLYHEDPVRHLAELGARMLVNCSASPFEMSKHDFRMRLFRSAAQRYKVPLLYCNQVGGNDELIFDGNSCVVDHTGEVIAQAKDFAEDLLVVDLPIEGEGPSRRGHASAKVQTNRLECPRRGLETAYHALVLGLRDYCGKCGFNEVVLGLSGGIDSALTAAICVGALGHERVRGVAMPSRYSSEGSVQDARDLAELMDIQLHVIPIAEPHEALDELLAPQWGNLPTDVTEENIQARLRGVILMAFSNKFRSLLVTTGNKSEMAVGYCTLYGDMAGGLAVLSDVPKTMVWELANWINESPQSPLRLQYGGPVIPENSITKPPSAELRPDQFDQQTLPPYPVLDELVERYVEREQSADQIVRETGFDPDIVLRVVTMIDRNEYKRKQAAPGLKITSRAFGFGRRMPIAQGWTNRITAEVK